MGTAVAHIITGVLGSGVLSLAWSLTQLGWIAGPIALIVFALITLFSSFLLCDCYRSLHPHHGLLRNLSYLHAVRFYLGIFFRSRFFCIYIQLNIEFRIIFVRDCFSVKRFRNKDPNANICINCMSNIIVSNIVVLNRTLITKVRMRLNYD